MMVPTPLLTEDRRRNRWGTDGGADALPMHQTPMKHSLCAILFYKIDSKYNVTH